MTFTTRFAPSPTGYIHIGNLRTALFNWLIARKNGGQFILRIDDTDAERSKQAYVDAIQQDMEWLGLTWDRIERQSARLDRYAEAADKLREMGRFYEAWETPVELDLKRKKQLNMGQPPVYDRAALALDDAARAALKAERGQGVWRFLLERERIAWEDGILGEISIDAASVSDPVLIRQDGQVLYTLASVVDDLEMGITDVVRGSDHVTNTATQIQIIEALGGSVPSFAHHSLLTGPQGEALSKRHGTLSIRDFREAGIEPMALLSLMARLGSSDPVELCRTHDELIAGFDIGKFGAAPTKFDAEDLKPMTARVIQSLEASDVDAELASAGVPADMRPAYWAAVRGNTDVRSAAGQWWSLFENGATAADVAEEDHEFVREALAVLGEPPYSAETWSDWTSAENIPWGILLLFGGGLALAAGFKNTGLASWIGHQLSLLDRVPLFLLLLLLPAAVNFLTEITSNVATASMLLPILAALALSIGVHPYGLMVATTLAASCAFMLPVATPPNAVVFGSGYLTIPTMMRVGLRMNLCSILILAALVYYFLPLVWGIDLLHFPEDLLPPSTGSIGSGATRPQPPLI